jgi:hypothetical protein
MGGAGAVATRNERVARRPVRIRGPGCSRLVLAFAVSRTFACITPPFAHEAGVGRSGAANCRAHPKATAAAAAWVRGTAAHPIRSAFRSPVQCGAGSAVWQRTIRARTENAVPDGIAASSACRAEDARCARTARAWQTIPIVGVFTRITRTRVGDALTIRVAGLDGERRAAAAGVRQADEGEKSRKDSPEVAVAHHRENQTIQLSHACLGRCDDTRGATAENPSPVF